MLAIARWLLLGLALVFAWSSQADDLAAVPPLKQRVTDLTGTLNASEQAALESRLAQFEQERGSQIAVLLVPTTQPEDIAQYAIRVVDSWKLGREKQDDGVLILVAKDDRKMRIEVGYGLEGTIPDVYAKRIVSDIMAPHFRQGDFYGGLNASVDQLTRLISGENLPVPPQTSYNQHGWSDMLPILLIGGLVLGGLMRSIFGSFFGGVVNGGLIGAAVWLLGGGLIMAGVIAIVAFLITMMGIFSLGGFIPFGGGGWGSGGGGFSGGGGGFGGGGASGDW